MGSDDGKIKWIPPAKRGNVAPLFIVRQRRGDNTGYRDSQRLFARLLARDLPQLQASVVEAGEATFRIYKSRDSAVTSRRCP